MIRNSFLFLEKISRKKEKNIWKQGIKHWQDFLQTEKISGVSKQKKYYYERKIKEAQQALLDNDSSYFMSKLPKKEMWRLYNSFKEECCFLDVEVDSQGKIILVGISDNHSTKQFVKCINLDKAPVERELNKYKLLITFNGSAFDLPKLKKELKVEINIPHIDLKPLCITLGLKGGLKEIEKILNLHRPAHLYGNPVELWKAFHASRDREWLELLLNYNKEDVENLQRIMEYTYKKAVEELQKGPLEEKGGKKIH
ncbi:MAG: ribonuclease H-like domain-containing protein [Nanoarchaeota archaeon]